MDTALVIFHYDELDQDTRFLVQQSARDIQECRESIKRNTVRIGKELQRVKALLDHGQFGRWLTAEFQWSISTAENMMRVATLVEQNRKVYDFEQKFGKTALYLLAAPSTPEEIRDHFINQAAAGGVVRHRDVAMAIKEYKQTDPGSSTTAPLTGLAPPHAPSRPNTTEDSSSGRRRILPAAVRVTRTVVSLGENTILFTGPDAIELADAFEEWLSQRHT